MTINQVNQSRLYSFINQRFGVLPTIHGE